MANSNPQPPKFSVVLRIVGGGYLMYLAFDLFRSGLSAAWMYIPVTAFAIVGTLLFASSLKSLITNKYFYTSSEEKTEETPPDTEETE